MKAVLALAVCGLLTVSLTVSGGVNSHSRGGIPVGEWQGRGVCVFEWWDARAPSPIEEAKRSALEDALGESYEDLPLELEDGAEAPGFNTTIYRRYPTRLRIWEERIGRRQITMLEMRSQRGALPGLGEETHTLVALEVAKRLSATTTLYRQVGFTFNPETEGMPALNESGPPCSATCTTIGDTTILQIRYLEDFVDTFRFEDARLEKSGLYHASGGLVHWTEQLEER